MKRDDRNLWMIAKLKESDDQARPEDDQRKSVCAADCAEEHAFPEADHRASPRARRGHTVVRVPSPPPIPD